jgi:hypothetical protein
MMLFLLGGGVGGRLCGFDGGWCFAPSEVLDRRSRQNKLQATFDRFFNFNIIAETGM